MTYGNIIFGDNQFLGVNHSSQQKASELYDRYSNPDAIIAVIAAAYDSGIRDFMFTTHDRYYPVFDEIRRSKLFPEMYYTPCLPYAHKYWNQLSDKGPIKLLTSTLSQIGVWKAFPASIATLLGKTRGVIHLLTEIETLMCKGLQVRGVFLQNAAFDFLLAMEQYQALEDFADVATRKLGILPGFITMNHPKALNALCDEIGLVQPWICSNYNVSGFRMHPSQTSVEQSFLAARSRNIAMSVFSSGKAGSAEALDYVVNGLHQGAVSSILFGSSSQANIRSNVQRINA
jgi:hypothetical protein